MNDTLRLQSEINTLIATMHGLKQRAKSLGLNTAAIELKDAQACARAMAAMANGALWHLSLASDYCEGDK